MNAICHNCGEVAAPGSAFCHRCGASLAATQQHTIPGGPRHVTATAEMVGRTCPYCRFPIKEGGPVAECGACRAVQHQDCFTENGGCAVAGCAGGPTAHTHGSHQPATSPGTPLPPPIIPVGGGRRPIATIIIVATVLVLLLAGGATALVVSSNGRLHNTSTATDSTNSDGTPCNDSPDSSLPSCDNTGGSTNTGADSTNSDGTPCNDSPDSSLPSCDNTGGSTDTAGSTGASTSSPAAASDGSGAVAAVDHYWQAIDSGDFHTAFGYLAPGQDTESSWIAAHQADGIQSAAFSGTATSVDSSTATVHVDSLQTKDTTRGCQNWSGEYQMVNQAGTWLINRAQITPSPC